MTYRLKKRIKQRQMRQAVSAIRLASVRALRSNESIFHDGTLAHLGYEYYAIAKLAEALVTRSQLSISRMNRTVAEAEAVIARAQSKGNLLVQPKVTITINDKDASNRMQEFNDWCDEFWTPGDPLPKFTHDQKIGIPNII